MIPEPKPKNKKYDPNEDPADLANLSIHQIQLRNFLLRCDALADMPDDKLKEFCRDWHNLSKGNRQTVHIRVSVMAQEGKITKSRHKYVEYMYSIAPRI